MNNILYWSILSSLITLLALSLIRDLIHYLKLFLKRVNFRYEIGDKVVIKLPSDKLLSGKITNQVYNPDNKEPVYSVRIIEKGQEMNIFVRENLIISTEEELIRFKITH